MWDDLEELISLKKLLDTPNVDDSRVWELNYGASHFLAKSIRVLGLSERILDSELEGYCL